MAFYPCRGGGGKKKKRKVCDIIKMNVYDIFGLIVYERERGYEINKKKSNIQ